MPDFITRKLPEFERYEGREKYAMLAFSYDDSEQVFPFIEALNSSGARLWYDKGAIVGRRDANRIIDHAEDCAAFIAFISPAFAENARMCNCLRYALKLGIPVTLIECRPVPEEAWTEGLREFIAAADRVGIDAEKAMSVAVSALAECGSTPGKAPDAGKAPAEPITPQSDAPTEEQPEDSAEDEGSGAETADGAQYIDLGAVRIGIDERRVEMRECGLTSIDGIENMTRLSVLILSGNNISDISVLSQLERLTTVNLSGNHITDLSALASLKNLSWLIISNNQISDITPLLGLNSLRNLYINGNPISKEDVERLRDALPKCSIVF